MAGYDGRAKQFPLVIAQGADLAFTLTVTDSADAAIDMSGATIAGELYNAAGGVVDTLSAAVSGAGSNVITLSLTDTETAALSGVERWTLWVTRGGDKRPWLAGRVTLVEASSPKSTAGSSTTLVVDSDVNVNVVASADGTGWTGGNYNAGTGVVTFTSDDGLGFATGDLRGADGEVTNASLTTTLADYAPSLAPSYRATAAIVPTGVLVVGDSTGNDGNEWVRDAADLLAAQVDGSVIYRLWNNSTDTWGHPTYRQTSDRGIATSDVTTQITATVDGTLTGTQSAAVELTNTSLSNSDILISIHGGGDPNRKWNLLWINNFLRLQFYPTGNNDSIDSASSTSALPAWTRIEVGFEMIPDNGAGAYEVKFYYRTSKNASWTQLGNTITGGSTTTMPSTDGSFNVGGRLGGVGVPDAIYHNATLYDGLLADGTVIAHWDAGLQLPGVEYTDPAGVTFSVPAVNAASGTPGWQVLNASISGAYFSTFDATLVGKIDNCSRVDTVVVNLGHNGGTSGVMASAFDTMWALLEASYPGATLVMTAQNPQTSAATNPNAHAMRVFEAVQVAKGRNARVIDVYRAFQDYGNWSTDLMVDTIHPNAAGSDLWAATALPALLSG